MKKESKIIGNEEEQKGIERLLEKAGKDKVIQKALGEYEYNSLGDLKFVPCEEARKLIKSIEEHVKSRSYEDGSQLFQAGVSLTHVHTYHNAALALAYFGMGEDMKGIRLIKGIEGHIGVHRKLGLVRRGTDHVKLYTGDSVLLALAYIACGRKTNAKNIIKAVEEHVGFDEKTGLVKAGTGILASNIGYTDDNALLALAYNTLGRNSDKSKILRGVGEHIGYYRKTMLVLCSTEASPDDYKRAYASNSTALALAYAAAFGDKDHSGFIASQTLMEAIENDIGFDFETGLLNLRYGAAIDNVKPSIAGNALFALCKMAEKYYEETNKLLYEAWKEDAKRKKTDG